MSADQVALIARGAECEAYWLPADEESWEAYLTDDEPPAVTLYCPDCSFRAISSVSSSASASPSRGSSFAVASAPISFPRSIARRKDRVRVTL